MDGQTEAQPGYFIMNFEFGVWQNVSIQIGQQLK